MRKKLIFRPSSRKDKRYQELLTRVQRADAERHLHPSERTIVIEYGSKQAEELAKREKEK